MPASQFQLKYNGVQQTLAAWGIEDCQFESNDFAADTVTFMVGGRELDAADLFAYGSTVEIFFPDGATRWFYGRVEPWERDGTASALNHFGRLVGPWFYLEKTYKARFRFATFDAYGNLTGYNNYTSPRVILNVGQAANANGFASWSVGQQLADVINYFNTLGFPLQLGVVAPYSNCFSSPQQGITGAEVIRMMFQREPDFTCIWDYTTTPPTIHFKKSSNLNLAPGLTLPQQAQLILPAVNVNLDDIPYDHVKIKPRPDLQRSYVNLYYEITSSQNGQQYLGIVQDVYPNPQPTDPQSLATGIDMVVNLQGQQSSSQQQSCEFTSQPFDPTNINQWIEWKASLAAEDVASAVVMTAATTDDPVNHPPPTITAREEGVAYNPANAFEILDGSWAPWMLQGNLQVTAQKVRVTAWIRVVKKRGVNGVQHTDYIQVNADFTATSINTNGEPVSFFVATQNITQYAEPVPVGLAKSMYLAWQSLGLEGSLEQIQGIITTTIGRNFSLNFITPNQPAWANALCCVRRVSGSLDQGVTRIEFGARLRMMGLQLLDFLRSTRYRVLSVSITYYFGGALGGPGGGTITQPQKMHPRSVEHSSTHNAVHVTSEKAQPAQGTDPIFQVDGGAGVITLTPGAQPSAPPIPQTSGVTIDSGKLLGSDGNWHQVQLTEMTTCESDGTQWTRIILLSEKYKAPGQS